MSKELISFNINGVKHEVKVEPSARLIDIIREDFGLLGTKEGCGEGECGACTIIFNGEVINSCLILAGQAEGANIVTIEGLSSGGELSKIQQSFIDAGAVQCGFCTPGMVLSAKALLDKNPKPTEKDIRVTFSGNLCRCTGYQKIVKAVQLAAQQ